MPKRRRAFSFDVFRKSSLVKNLNKNRFCKDFLSIKRHYFGNIFFLFETQDEDQWMGYHNSRGGLGDYLRWKKSTRKKYFWKFSVVFYFCWCNFLNQRILALLLQAGNWHFPFLLKIADDCKSSYTTTLKKWVLVQKKHFWTFWALFQKKHSWLLSKTA